MDHRTREMISQSAFIYLENGAKDRDSAHKLKPEHIRSDCSSIFLCFVGEMKISSCASANLRSVIKYITFQFFLSMLSIQISFKLN